MELGARSQDVVDWSVLQLSASKATPLSSASCNHTQSIDCRLSLFYKMRCFLRAALIVSSLSSAGKVSALGQTQQPVQITSEDKPAFDSSFDAFVKATLLEWHVPGLSIAVVDNGKTTSKVSSCRLICTPSSASAQ